MDVQKMLIAAEQLKQGLLAKATDGDYEDKDYKADLAVLQADQRVAKMLPTVIMANRTAADFRRTMQAQFSHYFERRKYIADQLSPIFDYLHSIENGTDSFTQIIEADALGEPLGRGGFGSVYKYHHKLLDMDFALKLFEPIFVSNEENLEGEKRFFREAKILFSLNHENIIRVYDIGRYNGQPFIRMEYVDGYTMSDFVSKNGTVSFKRSVKPITALLQGLEYAHNLGVIHRDLKPANFMVTASGAFKIIDFGISAYLDVEGYTKLTKTGEAIAGGAYTDPQLIENPKLRDVRSDIYSVGAIWYYLLVGSAPLGGDLKRNLLESGKASELEIGIILKCMSSRPEDRYKSCAEILSILAPSPMKSTDEKANFQRRNITEITRRGIFDYIVDRNNEDLNAYVLGDSPIFQEPERVFNYFGRRNPVQFLEKLYDLDDSEDPRAETLREELYRHTVQNDDYPYGWIFEDSRFHLIDGDDETLLKFLAMMFHPLIRSEKSEWETALNEINALLAEDGYEIYASEKISGKTVYSYRYNT